MNTINQLQVTTKRISWIDVSRGLAIILVLYGHYFVSDKYNYVIFAFHMPLFFFISGLVFKTTGQKALSSIISKYFKQLLIPYYLFALGTYGFTLLSQTAGDISPKGILWQLFGILYGNGNDGMLGYNVVLWFLPCLFLTKLLFAMITRKVSQTKNLIGILFFSAFCGYLISLFTPWLKLPFSFEIALTGISFFGAGYFVKKYQKRLTVFIQQQRLMSITALLFTILIATVNYRISGAKVDLRVNQLGNIFLFYFGAFGGIIGIITVSRILTKNAFLEYIGKHSMILFAWHNVLFTDLTNYINSVVTQDLLNNIKFFMPTFYAIVVTSIIFVSRLLFIKLKGAYRFLPFGKQGFSS